MSPWTMTEGRFTSWDGTELFCRSWEPSGGGDKALVVIHRGHEHSGRVQQQIEDLGLEGFWAFSWDNRGHGHSPGPRGYAESYYHLVKDLDTFVHHVSETHRIPMENIAILANSVGAVTAATWVHDYAPRIRAMVLAAPAFRIKLYLPFARPVLRMVQKFKDRAFISSYVKSKVLTHDEEQARSYDEDELITRDIAVNVLLGLHDTSTRIIADAGAITTPTLVLSAGSDWVVKSGAQRRFFEGLSSPMKEFSEYPGFYHALLYEKERMKPLGKAREFLLQAFDDEVDTSFLMKADEAGYTRKEYDRLRRPAAPHKAIGYGLQRLGLSTLGKMSDGIRLGEKVGYDSGRSLDYVYENQARGIPPLGRAIDRGYLDAVGWKGIRERGANLSTMLGEQVDRLLAEGKTVRILDVATGCGRYVLDMLKDRHDDDIHSLLRDFTPGNLDTGRANAEALGVQRVTFEEGDAFDTASILAVHPPPNIVIVSGLFELFPENAPILASLRGISSVLEEGGSLFYTCQPWHPQVELIARTCVNREGKPWIMRRRTQAEMDELVRHFGLQKVEQRIDANGIFSVARAVKGPAH